MFKLLANQVASADPCWQTNVLRGGVEVIAALAAEWRALCAEGICDQPFYQPEWIRAYVHAFAPDQSLAVLTVRQEGKLRAVLPMIEERSSLHGVPVKKLRSASNVHSCRFDVIIGSEPNPEAVLQALWQQLQQLSGWSVIELLDVPVGGGSDGLLTLAKRDGCPTGRWELNPGPYLALPANATTFDDALAHVNTGFRGKLRQYKRQLAMQGKLQLHLVETADAAALESFYQLEGKGWKGSEGTAIQNDRATQCFYDEVAQAAAATQAFRHYRLELNDRLIAAYFGIYQNGQYFALKSAYDESFSRYTPGNIMVQEILCDLLSGQAQEFDFLGSWAEWKGRWSKQVRPQSHCYIFRRGALGTALHALKFKLLPPLRQAKQQWEEKRAAHSSHAKTKQGNQHSTTTL